MLLLRLRPVRWRCGSTSRDDDSVRLILITRALPYTCLDIPASCSVCVGCAEGHVLKACLHFSFFYRHFYFPAQLAGGFTPQQSSGQAVVTGFVLSPLRYVRSFFIARRFSISTGRRFSLNAPNSRSRDFRWSAFTQENVLTSIHSVRLEPSKLILVSTRTTYLPTLDAASCQVIQGASLRGWHSPLGTLAQEGQIKRKHIKLSEVPDCS